jgi:hypothetical protein
MEGLIAPKDVHECTSFGALAGELQKIIRLKIKQHAKLVFLKLTSLFTVQRSNTSTIVN